MDNKEYLNAERAASWREALRKSKPNKDRINISRTEMNELTPDYRITCNEEVNQGLTREQALIEASRCLDCPDPLCITGCPVYKHTQIHQKHRTGRNSRSGKNAERN